MSGLLFLTQEDFTIVPSAKGTLLCQGIRGYSLILFYSTACAHCQSLIPKFKRLPGTVGGCQFGMVNVSNNKQLVAMSKGTLTEIRYVPLIILYVDGRAFMRYDGPHTESDIQNFIYEVSQMRQTKQKFSEEKVKPHKKGKEIPGFTIGFPKTDDSVSYLEWDEAYLVPHQRA